jgi:8-amino-7-oxononanoate synthase
MSDSVGEPLAWIDDEMRALDRAGLRRKLATRDGPLSETICLDGRQLINFGSNDYLGLAGDSRLVEAANRTSSVEGWGSGASPLICGHTSTHRKLEQELARFEGTETALLFPTGFAANLGTIPTLVGRGDAVFSDEKNHASLVDGCRISRAQTHIYRHKDCEHLGSLIKESAGARRRLIVTDTLFSMDGDLAPLVDIVDIAARYRCMLMVDEAHATGVYGALGRGVAEHLGVESEVDIKVGTLSKAMGCAGGFVCGRRRLIEWLVNRSRPYVFSTAQPAATVAAALAALQLVQDEPQRRSELLKRATEVRAALTDRGWNVGGSVSQIIPIRIGDPGRVMQMTEALADVGIFVPGIRPPSVPDGQSLLRLSLTFRHSADSIRQLIEALSSLI